MCVSRSVVLAFEGLCKLCSSQQQAVMETFGLHGSHHTPHSINGCTHVISLWLFCWLLSLLFCSVRGPRELGGGVVL